VSGLNILLVEGQPGSGAADAAQLTEAGNQVFRCFPETWGTDRRRHPFVCTGVSEGSCPLEHGVDVALVVRPHPTARPSGLEAGALCALRQGVPLVERGAETFDPYEPWIDGRVNGDVVRACERAIEHHFDGLRREIAWRIEPVLSDAGIAITDLAFSFDTRARELHVTITGPAIAKQFEQRLAVRVADAIRAGRRSFTKKNFAYEVAA
jgi:hypothetical protein